MPENKHLRFFVILVYIALGLFLFWFLLRHALGWILPFIIAFILSRLIEKPVKLCTKHLKIPRPISSGVFTILAFSSVGWLVYFLISRLLRELKLFLANLPDTSIIISEVAEYLNNLFSSVMNIVPGDIQEFIIITTENLINEGLTFPKEFFGDILSYSTNVASYIPSIILFIIAVLVSTYFMSSDYDNIKAYLASNMPIKWKSRFIAAKDHLFSTLLSYLRAILILLSLTFVELLIGFAIMDIKYSLVLAFFISLIDSLPIFGTGTVLIPWAIVNLIRGDFPGAVGIAILYGVITIVRNIVEPKIIGNQIGLHPLVTLISIYIGIKIFGLMGILLPIAIVLIKHFYELERHVSKAK